KGAGRRNFSRVVAVVQKYCRQKNGKALHHPSSPRTGRRPDGDAYGFQCNSGTYFSLLLGAAVIYTQGIRGRGQPATGSGFPFLPWWPFVFLVVGDSDRGWERNLRERAAGMIPKARAALAAIVLFGVGGFASAEPVAVGLPLSAWLARLERGARDQKPAAAYQLGEIGPGVPGVAEALLKALDDPDAGAAAVEALAGWGAVSVPH